MTESEYDKEKERGGEWSKGRSVGIWTRDGRVDEVEVPLVLRFQGQRQQSNDKERDPGVLSMNWRGTESKE